VNKEDGISAQRSERKYACCPELYPDVTFTPNCPYTLHWAAPSPKIAPSRGDLDSHPSNTRFLGPIRAHNRNGILIGSAIFCTDDRRLSLYFTMGRPFAPSKLPVPVGDLDPHLKRGRFDPPESSTRTAFRSVQPFFAQTTADCPCTLQWAAPSPRRNCPFPWGIWTPI